MYKYAEEEEQIQVPDISSKCINIIKQFYEAHGYDEDSIKVTLPLKNNDIASHIDEISFEAMQQYMGMDNMDILIELMHASEILELNPSFKNICIACLSYEFSLGPTIDDLRDFQNEFPVTLSAQQEKFYQQEFEKMYEEINNQQIANMNQNYVKLENSRK